MNREEKEKRKAMDIINFRCIFISFTQMCIHGFIEIITVLLFGINNDAQIRESDYHQELVLLHVPNLESQLVLSIIR